MTGSNFVPDATEVSGVVAIEGDYKASFYQQLLRNAKRERTTSRLKQTHDEIRKLVIRRAFKNRKL